jgi:hypothetical protein
LNNRDRNGRWWPVEEQSFTLDLDIREVPTFFTFKKRLQFKYFRNKKIPCYFSSGYGETTCVLNEFLNLQDNLCIFFIVENFIAK